MQGKKSLYDAQNQFKLQKADNLYYLSGNLGFLVNNQQTVEVTNRAGFVYVRLRSNTSEVIQAYNEKVSPVYDLPVLVARDKINTNRYFIVSVDSQKYSTWNSAYLVRHGSQHSFNPPTEGGDITWIYGKQFMPLAPFPSGTIGSLNLIIKDYSFYSQTDSAWKYISTGTVSFSSYKPTDNQSRMVLIYLNDQGNVNYKSGSLFASSITGTSTVLPYVPGLAYGEIPIGGVRLVSGTSTISWDDIYDLRPYFTSDAIHKVKKEIYFPVTRLTIGAAAATATTRAVGASGSIKVPVMSFSKTTEQEVYFEAHMPYDVDGNVNAQFHLMWQPGAAWTSGNYMWKVDYLIKSSGGSLITGTPTTIEADVTPLTATDTIETVFVDTIDIGPDQVLWARLWRDVANDNGNDTGEVRFCEIEYTSDKLGEAI